MPIKSRYQAVLSRIRKWLVSLDLLAPPKKRTRLVRKSPTVFADSIKYQLIEHAAMSRNLYGEGADGPSVIYIVTDLMRERGIVMDMLEDMRPRYVATNTRFELMSTAYASTGWSSNESNTVLLAFTSSRHPDLRTQLLGRLRHPNSTTVIFNTASFVTE